MVLGFMVPNYIPSGRSDFFTPSILLFTWFCHITSGGWMVVWYDVIFAGAARRAGPDSMLILCLSVRLCMCLR